MGSGRDESGLDGGHVVPDMDEVVGDYSKADPSFHPAKSFIAGSLQPMPTFENTDTAFAPRAPVLKLLEPTLLLLLFSLPAGSSVGGDGNVFHSHLLGGRFVGGGKESGIGCHRPRRAAKLLAMVLQRGN